MTDPDLLKPSADAALIEALKLTRLAQLKADGRDPSAADEAALLSLVGAKFAAIDRHDRVQRTASERITRPEVRRFLDAIVASLRRHVTDAAVLRAVQADAQQQLEAGGFAHEATEP